MYYIGHVYNKPRYMWIVLYRYVYNKPCYMWIVLYRYVYNKPCYMQLVLYYIGMYTTISAIVNQKLQNVLHVACVVLYRHVYNNISNCQSKTTKRVTCVFVVLYRHVYSKPCYLWLVLYSIGMCTTNSIPCGLCCVYNKPCYI